MQKIFIATHLKITNPIAYLVFAFLFVAIQPAITLLLFQTANWFLFIYKYVNGEYLITGAIYMFILFYSTINIGQLINAYRFKEKKEITEPVKEEKVTAFDINNVIKRKSYSALKEAVRNPTLEKDEKKELIKDINKELNITLKEIQEKITEINTIHKSKLKLVDINILLEQSLDDVQYSGDREKTTVNEQTVNETEKNIFEQVENMQDYQNIGEIQENISKNNEPDLSDIDEIEIKEEIHPEIELKEKEKKRQNKLKNYPKESEEE